MLKYFEVFYLLNGDELYYTWSDHPFPSIDDKEKVRIEGKDYMIVKKSHARTRGEVTTNYHVTSRD
jgi:hypothetical protein